MIESESPAGRFPPLLGPVEQAFDDFDAHFERLRTLVFDAELTLADLVEIEIRMRKSLAAVRAGGVRVRPILEAALEADDVSSAAAAVYAASEIEPTWFSTGVLKRYPELTPATQDGFRLALRQLSLEGVEGDLVRFASEGPPFARACASEVLAFHGRALPDGFETLLDDEDPEVRRLAIRAAGARRDARWNRARFDREIAAGNEETLEVAFEAAVWRKLGPLNTAVRPIAAAVGPCAPVALRFFGAIARPQALPFFVDALNAAHAAEDHETASGALDGMAALGSVESIPCIIESLSHPTSIRAAGAAFLRITGAQGLEGDVPIPPPEGIDGDDADFWDDSPAEVDEARARAWWADCELQQERASRVQWGSVMTTSGGIEDLASLPTRIRRDEWIRRCYESEKTLRHVELERLPSLQW